MSNTTRLSTTRPATAILAAGLGHEGGFRSLDFFTAQQAVHIALTTLNPPPFARGDAEASTAEPGADGGETA